MSCAVVPRLGFGCSTTANVIIIAVTTINIMIRMAVAILLLFPICPHHRDAQPVLRGTPTAHPPGAPKQSSLSLLQPNGNPRSQKLPQNEKQKNFRNTLFNPPTLNTDAHKPIPTAQSPIFNSQTTNRAITRCGCGSEHPSLRLAPGASLPPNARHKPRRHKRGSARSRRFTRRVGKTWVGTAMPRCPRPRRAPGHTALAPSSLGNGALRPTRGRRGVPRGWNVGRMTGTPPPRARAAAAAARPPPPLSPPRAALRGAKVKAGAAPAPPPLPPTRVRVCADARPRAPSPRSSPLT